MSKMTCIFLWDASKRRVSHGEKTQKKGRRVGLQVQSHMHFLPAAIPIGALTSEK